MQVIFLSDSSKNLFRGLLKIKWAYTLMMNVAITYPGADALNCIIFSRGSVMCRTTHGITFMLPLLSRHVACFLANSTEVVQMKAYFRHPGMPNPNLSDVTQTEPPSHQGKI